MTTLELEKENEALKREVEELRNTVAILANGLGPGFNSWRDCALRLRRELLRVDPTNRTESQIDWRMESDRD